MKQISVQFNSEQKFQDRNTKEDFYFVRIVQQDSTGKFIELPSAKLLASSLPEGASVQKKSSAMVLADSVIKDTLNEDGTTRYLGFSNAKVMAVAAPAAPKRQIDEDALAALVESDQPY